jgi:hypothetical protein
MQEYGIGLLGHKRGMPRSRGHEYSQEGFLVAAGYR